MNWDESLMTAATEQDVFECIEMEPLKLAGIDDVVGDYHPRSHFH
jgi:hypothetical protein